MRPLLSKGLIGRATIILVILAMIALNFNLHRPAVASNESVEVWLTLPDGSKKLVQETNLNFAAGSGTSGDVIEVNPAILYQQVEGIGAAMTDSSAWLINNKLTPVQRDALMSDLFTRAGDGVGLNYVRVPMGASDFALSSYTYDDMPAGETDPTLANFSISHDNAYIIPVLQDALVLNPQLRFMGTPWSAPAWMKTNENLNGGSLSPAYRQQFADYHVKFLQAYQAAGIPMDAISVQNEPMHETSSYPSMLMSPAEQTVFIRDYLGPALVNAGLDPKILALDHNWDLTNYALTVLNDPDALAYVDGTAFHCYAGQVANQSVVHNSYQGKGIWFTECSGGEWSTDFGDNVSWNMHNLVIGNFRNWGKSLLLWNIALDEDSGPQNGGCSNCRGVVTIDQSTGDVTYNEEYYILGHVSKFVDPGAYRADSTNYADGQPENVAFLNPDGSVVLIVHSTAATTFDVEWNGEHFTYALPAKGTVTFKWHAASTPGATVTPVPTATQAPTATPYPAGMLQPFEEEGTYYPDYQVTPSLTTDVVYSGTTALKAFSDSGEWHTVGAYLNDHPINATGLDSICLWVYDTTAADNSMGFRLIDSTGASQELWSDNAAVGTNTRTIQNTWVQMCFDLAPYTLVNLASLDRVQMAMYWAGTYYFDDITGVASEPPTATATPISTPYPAGMLQPFEVEGTYYPDYQVTPSLSTEVVYSGATSLKAFSDSGEWHTVGAYLNDHPIDATGLDGICLWVYDTTAADNSMGFRLIDSSGTSQEIWSDNPVVGTNPKTVQNTWVQMCFDLDAYNGVNLASLDRVQMAVYWAGTYYFDDITGVASEPPTSTPLPTSTPTSTPYPAGTLQPFETEGTYYPDYQVMPSLSTEVVHSGATSLKVFSDSGEWHTVGAYLDNRPINATEYDRLCFWVYDTTAANNSVGFRIFDASGANQEIWSDNPAVGTNSNTVQNTWVQMCFNLAAYSAVNMAALDKVQMAVYWAGTYYFDEITGLAPEPPITPSPTATQTPTATPTMTATPTPVRVTQVFKSSANRDGWILESAENSNQGGDVNNGSETLRIGDDRKDRQYKSILSFNTSGLPNGAEITSVQLRIKQVGAPEGANAFSVLGDLLIDIRTGTFGLPALRGSDFKAAASLVKGGMFPQMPVDNWYTANLDVTTFSYINKTGNTQFRLYFRHGDNDNRIADFLRFASGNAHANQPELIVSYTLP